MTVDEQDRPMPLGYIGKIGEAIWGEGEQPSPQAGDSVKNVGLQEDHELESVFETAAMLAETEDEAS